jgi:hypothetical protein
LSFFGVVLFCCDAESGPIVGLMHDGTILPLVLVVSFCFIASVVFYCVFVLPAPETYGRMMGSAALHPSYFCYT